MTYHVFEEERALVIETSDPARLLNSIPSAFQLTDTIVGCPHGVDEVIRLNLLGIEVPSPMQYHYNWPREHTKIPQPYHHQTETAAFAVTNPHGFILNDIGCVDADTEYLSPTGWHRIAEYTEGKVGQYNLDGIVEFVEPKAFVRKPCTEMIRFKTKYGIDQLLSPDHTVLYVASAGGRMTAPAHVVEGIYNDSACGWPGRFITTFTPQITTTMPLTDAQLRIQVAVIADGHFANKTPRCVMRLKKGRKKERLRQLLKMADIDWAETSQDTRTAVGFTVFTFPAPVRAKEFNAPFWQSSLAQLKVIADELVHWDGSARKAGGASFSTTAQASANFAQYAYAATGRTATLTVATRVGYKPEYVVHARADAALLYLKGTNAGVKSPNVSREPSPDGFMYCFEVPSGFLILRRNGCIFATGNTGKTLSALWAADYLMAEGLARKALIIAPLSTLERVWGDALFIHFPHRKFAILHGVAAKRKKLLAEPRDFYVVNHDGIAVIEKELSARPDIDIIIIDEVAVYRNRQTGKWKAINSILYPRAPALPKPWVWGMTGTPIPNSPEDAYGQCRLVTPDSVPKYFTQWRNMVMDHQSTYIWTPRPEATRIVYAAMRPAIRFKRDECLDLPPCVYQTRDVQMSSDQTKHYKEIMQELYTEVQGHKVTAMNEGVKLSKLLQVACIRYGTPVLTDCGWVPIQEVSSEHKVWDGIEWVAQHGAQLMGVKQVEHHYGVWMTPDHKVLTTDGWKRAEETRHGESGKKFTRAEVWLPDSYKAGWYYSRNQNSKGHMVMPMSVREQSSSRKSVSSDKTSGVSAQLWLPSWERNPQNDVYPGVQYLDTHTTALREFAAQGLEKLRRTGDYCVQAVAAIIRELLGGHGGVISVGAYAGQDRQQPWILQSELPVGDSTHTIKQQTHKCTNQHPSGGDDCGRGSTKVQPEAYHHIPKDSAGEHRPGAAGYQKVYDLIECGSRNRFVVLGDTGPLIVHNCGVVYDSTGAPQEIDAGNRIETLMEIIEQIGEKVIVFVPFTAVTGRLARELNKHWNFAVITGETPIKERNQIFADFQNPEKDIDIVAHPGCMSHGLTLTEASTIIWYAPIDSNDTYQQANGRITRAGQHHTANIVNLAGSAVERKMYKRLEQRQSAQGLLLDMIERGEK